MEFLLIGTSNPGKLREYAVLLADLPVRLLSLRDAGLDSLDIEEPYETFEENAAHKARAYAQASGLLAFADDSGLVVDALGGRPGVYSARYGGPTDRDRYMKLLGELENVPDEQRTARFVCVSAAADPQQRAAGNRARARSRGESRARRAKARKASATTPFSCRTATTWSSATSRWRRRTASAIAGGRRGR